MASPHFLLPPCRRGGTCADWLTACEEPMESVKATGSEVFGSGEGKWCLVLEGTFGGLSMIEENKKAPVLAGAWQE